MSFPTQPQPQPGPPAPAPYKASKRSRVLVWTIAVVILGTLVGWLGYAVFGVARDRARDDKVLGTCHQAVRRQMDGYSGEANFYSERVSQPADDRAEAFGTMEYRGVRRSYTCVAQLVGGRWEATDVRFDH